MAEIEIPENDLLITCKDPSYNGGQHVGWYSGVTVEHVPSGIIVTVATERSQHMNRKIAMDALLGALTSPHFRG